jgi:hypothetical protein
MASSFGLLPFITARHRAFVTSPRTARIALVQDRPPLGWPRLVFGTDFVVTHVRGEAARRLA